MRLEIAFSVLASQAAIRSTGMPHSEHIARPWIADKAANVASCFRGGGAMCSARVSNKAIRQQLSHSQRAYDVPFLNDVSISKWVILRRSRRTPDQLTSTHPVPNFSATKIVSNLAIFRQRLPAARLEFIPPQIVEVTRWALRRCAIYSVLPAEEPDIPGRIGPANSRISRSGCIAG